jgi:starch phosphorylase
MRALDALGIQPTVCHMNEGHCAFVGLERLRLIMDAMTSDAWKRHGKSCRAPRCSPPTHPVAAGHDEFPPAMVKPYLEAV